MWISFCAKDIYTYTVDDPSLEGAIKIISVKVIANCIDTILQNKNNLLNFIAIARKMHK